MLDLITIAIIAVGAILGYTAGALRQVLHIGCLVAAYVFSIPVGRPIADFILGRWDIPVPAGYAIGRFVGGLLVYIAGRIISSQLDRHFGSDGEGRHKPWNRKWGAVLGGAKALVIALVLLWVIDLSAPSLQARKPELFEAYRKSSLAQIAAAVNPLGDLQVADDVRVIKTVIDNPQLLTRLGEDPKVQELLRHPRIEEVTSDPEIAEAIANRDYKTLMRHEKIRALLDDEEMVEKLKEIRVMKILREAAAEASLEEPAAALER